jgi:hypothetical protein
MVPVLLAATFVLAAAGDPRGSIAWVRQAEIVGATALAAAPDGGVVVTGTGINAAAFGRGEPDEARLAADRLSHGAAAWSTWLAKYDAAGRLAFLRQTRGPASAAVQALSVAADGRIFVAGTVDEYGRLVFGAGEPRATTFQIFTGQGAFLACYDAAGRLAWARMETANRQSGIGFKAVLPEPDGGALAFANVAGPVVFGAGTAQEARFSTDAIPNADRYPGFQPAVVAARYGPGGELLWARRLGDPGRVNVTAAARLPGGGAALAVSYAGATAFGALALPPGSNEGVALVTLAPDARVLSVVPVLGAGASAAHLVAWPAGGVVLLGNFHGSPVVAGQPPLRTMGNDSRDWGSSFLVRVDPGGRVVAAKTIGSFYLAGAAPFGDGLVTWGSYYRGTAIRGRDGRERPLAAEGVKDTVLAGYGADGDLEWFATSGSRRMQEAWAVAAMPDGALALAGGTWGGITLGRGEPAPAKIDGTRGGPGFVVRFVAGRHPLDGGRQEELPRDASALARLRNDGTTAFKKKQYGKACDLFRRATEAAPWHGGAVADLALCLEKSGDAAAAIATNWRAIAVSDSEDPSTSESEQVRSSAFYNLWRLGVRAPVPAAGKCAPLQPAPGCEKRFHACSAEGGMTARIYSASWTWVQVGRTAQEAEGGLSDLGASQNPADWLTELEKGLYYDDGGDPALVLRAFEEGENASEEPEETGACEVVAADACKNRIVFSCAWKLHDGKLRRALRERWVTVPRE